MSANGRYLDGAMSLQHVSWRICCSLLFVGLPEPYPYSTFWKTLKVSWWVHSISKRSSGANYNVQLDAGLGGVAQQMIRT